MKLKSLAVLMLLAVVPLAYAQESTADTFEFNDYETFCSTPNAEKNDKADGWICNFELWFLISGFVNFANEFAEYEERIDTKVNNFEVLANSTMNDLEIAQNTTKVLVEELESNDSKNTPALKSLFRDVYKEKWITMLNELMGSSYTVLVNSATYEDDLMNGKILMYNVTNQLYANSLPYVDAAQQRYDDFFLANPTYNPDEHDLSLPSDDGKSRINFQYNDVNNRLEQAIERRDNILSFNASIPENLFMIGMEPRTVSWNEFNE